MADPISDVQRDTEEKCEARGVEATREQLRLGRIKGLSQLGYARNWLARQDKALSDASQSAQIDFSRRAAEAAEAAGTSARLANTHAKTANKIAAAALLAAAIAIAISIGGLFVGRA